MLTVVFENAYFLIVDKPSGWLSVPSREGESDKRNCVSLELKKNHALILPVHRLDFEVSGLLSFAKTKDAQRAANSWFEKHEIVKTYFAKTEGDAELAKKSGGRWESQLVRGKKRAFEAPHGKKSVTLARFLGPFENLHWELQPLTGRSHQLRYELAKRKFPIIGDVLYGAQPDKESQIELRAIRLDFSKCSLKENYDLPNEVRVR